MEKVQISAIGPKKRKRGEKIFQFDTFCEPGHPTYFNGPFHENIRLLLGFGNHEANMVKGMQCWSFQLEVNHHHLSYVRLMVIEEEVGTSLFPQCHYCRSIGWGHHMISNRRYHFVLPSRDTSFEVDNSKQEENGKASNKGIMGTLFVDLKKHLMHGVVHSNGFGHLLCINGLEGGSDFISGQQILDFWDRICNALQLWKVSLIDFARKGSMELRLIHGIAYGEPWFGRWDYKFSHGTYGITQLMYQRSLQALQSLRLCNIVSHFALSSHEIPIIIVKYQSISSYPLLTLGDLIRFMLELKSRVSLNSPTAIDFQGIITETSSRWSMKRIEMAAQVIVHALKKSEYRWVTRQDVRDEARIHIGDTGLLDYVLKSLGNHIVGNYIVRREVNPATKVLEYCLEDISSAFPKLDNIRVTRVQLMKDMLYLYKHILSDQRPPVISGIPTIPLAIRTVLDTKHLVKELPRHNATNGQLQILCAVRAPTYGRTTLTPYETVNVSSNATMEVLKREVERSFRDMYLGLKTFEAESVVGYSDSDQVVAVAGLGRSVVVEGAISNGSPGEMFEDGGEERVVECLCGAKEDDGERMVCCDICEVWQHTRCARIAANEEVPRVFLCGRCDNDIVTFPAIYY